MGKKWYMSLTVWYNVAIFAIATINQFAQVVPISPVVLGYVAVVGNVLLRFKTAVPIITGDDAQV